VLFPQSKGMPGKIYRFSNGEPHEAATESKEVMWLI